MVSQRVSRPQTAVDVRNIDFINLEPALAVIIFVLCLLVIARASCTRNCKCWNSNEISVLLNQKPSQAKPTTIKEALKRWEEKSGEAASEAIEVVLTFQWPPIEKMDHHISTLINCQKLSLSTNMIEKITGLNGLKNLKILSLGRNYIKSLAGLDPVADTLEELWISHNFIEKLKGIDVLKKLRVLYMSNNLVKEWVEFNKLQECPCLEDLVFVGNPIHDNMEEVEWRMEVHKRLPVLKKLDGEPIVPDQTIQ